ncbi:MAG: LamG domain-containing protein, partial [Candidatus Nanohaloarchaea archaeon]
MKDYTMDVMDCRITKNILSFVLILTGLVALSSGAAADIFITDADVDSRPVAGDTVNVSLNISSTSSVDKVFLNLSDDQETLELQNAVMNNDSSITERYYYSYDMDNDLSSKGLWNATFWANNTAGESAEKYTPFYSIAPSWYNTSKEYRHNLSSSASSELFGPLTTSPINEGFDTQDHWVYGTWRGENGENLDVYHEESSEGGWNTTEVGNATNEYCSFQTLPKNNSNCKNKPDGLVAYWTLDESGSKAQDYIGGHDGTIDTAVTQGAEGKVGNAYDFTGNAGAENGGVDASNLTNIPLDGNLTISMWMKPDSVSSKRMNPIDKAYGGEFAFTLESGGNGPPGSLSTYFGPEGDETSPYAQNQWTDVASENEWSHIVWVRDVAEKDLYLYKNGKNWSSNQSIDDNWETPGAGDQPVKIGTGYADNFDGSIDGVRIYNRTLSKAEASALYNQSKIGKRESVSNPPVDVGVIETEPEPVEETETVNVTVNATDLGGALENVTINLTDADGNLEVENGVMINDSSTKTQYYYEYTPASEASNLGTWTAKVRATNTLGYSNSNTSSLEVVENDKIKPEWRRLVDDSEGDLVKGQSMEISAEFLDNISGIEKAKLQTNETGTW